MCKNKQNEKTAKYFSKTKQFSDNQNYLIKSIANEFLDIPCCRTNVYGIHPAKYHCIIDCDNFKKQSPRVTPIERTHSASVKNNLKFL